MRTVRRKEDTPRRVFRFTESNKGTRSRRILPEVELHDTDLFCRVQTINSDRFIRYYQINKKVKKQILRNSLMRIINRFFKIVAHRISDNESGVFLERLGYFYILREPARKINKVCKNPTNIGVRYKPIFVPIRPDGKLDKFTMDYAFSSKVVRAVNKNKSKIEEPYNSCLKMLIDIYSIKHPIILQKRDDFNK